MAQRRKTPSTCVSSIDYNKKAQTLTVSFVKGGEHSYQGIDQSTVTQFRRASSKGRYFNANIRPRG